MAALASTPRLLLAYARAATLLAAAASLLLAFLSAWAGNVEGRALPAVLLINGTADPINPFEGRDVVLPPGLGGLILGRVLSSSETVMDAPLQAWAFLQRTAPRASSDTTAAVRPQLSVPPQAVSLAVLNLLNRQRQPKVHENG